MMIENKSKSRILALVGILLLFTLSLPFVSADDGDNLDINTDSDNWYRLENAQTQNNDNLNFNAELNQGFRLQNTATVSRDNTLNLAFTENSVNGNVINSENESSDDNVNPTKQNSEKTAKKTTSSETKVSDSKDSNNKVSAFSADASMKSTGMPVIAIILVLLTSLSLGISRKK